MIIFDIFILFFLMYLDTKIYRKLMTPLVILLTPIIISLMLMKIFESKMLHLSLEVHLLKITIIWLILGIILKVIFYSLKKEKNSEIFNKKVIKKLGILVIITLGINIFICANKYGIENLKGKTGGILEHFFIISSAFLSVELINKKGFLFKFLYVAILLSLFIRGGKYQLFLFILPSFFLSIEKEKKLSFRILKKSLFIFLVVFIVFGIVYYINFSLKNMNFNCNDFFNFIINHTKYYFLSPMYIGHEMLKFSGQGDFKIAFTPFINIYEFILGSKNYINPILPVWTSYGITSNVGGLIPELVYSIGNIGMYLYMTFLGIISYILENLTLKNKIWVYSNLILKSSLILCFFNNVFTVLGYVERVLGTIIITIVIIMFKKIKFIKN